MKNNLIILNFIKIVIIKANFFYCNSISFDFFKGSTLIIMHSKEESDSFFGGIALSSWDSNNKYICDPDKE